VAVLSVDLRKCRRCSSGASSAPDVGPSPLSPVNAVRRLRQQRYRGIRVHSSPAFPLASWGPGLARRDGGMQWASAPRESRGARDLRSLVRDEKSRNSREKKSGRWNFGAFAVCASSRERPAVTAVKRSASAASIRFNDGRHSRRLENRKRKCSHLISGTLQSKASSKHVHWRETYGTV